MQITGVVVLVGLGIILFEVFPEKSVWSIPVGHADEHMIAVPASGGFSLLLRQKQEAYKNSHQRTATILEKNIDCRRRCRSHYNFQSSNRRKQ